LIDPDAVDIIENLLDREFEPAIRIKETMRMSIRHPLRKLFNENLGELEDLTRKASVACAILWNFWVLATYLFFYFCLVYLPAKNWFIIKNKVFEGPTWDPCQLGN
jgi:hypothetical protein